MGIDNMDFFFQAEDGIRDYDVTGVQTCAVFRSNSPSLGESQLSPAGNGLEPSGRGRQKNSRKEEKSPGSAGRVLGSIPRLPANLSHSRVRNLRGSFSRAMRPARREINWRGTPGRVNRKRGSGTSRSKHREVGRARFYTCGQAEPMSASRSEERRVGKEGRTRGSPVH